MACEEPGKSPPSAAVLVRRVPVEPGTPCPADATRVEAGSDMNGDGQLDAGEVRSTEYVCQSEPPSSHCTEGGVAVQAGADADEDGALGEGEVSVHEKGCAGKAPGWTYFGDYDLRTTADVVALRGAGRISGALFIMNSEVERIDLPSLRSVGGSVLIRGNPKLTWFSAGIEELGLFLHVHDNPLLTSAHRGSADGVAEPEASGFLHQPGECR